MMRITLKRGGCGQNEVELTHNKVLRAIGKVTQIVTDCPNVSDLSTRIYADVVEQPRSATSQKISAAFRNGCSRQTIDLISIGRSGKAQLRLGRSKSGGDFWR
jgi:hypothetical protein